MTPAELLAQYDNGQPWGPVPTDDAPTADWPVAVGQSWRADFDAPLTQLQVRFR